MTLIRNSSFALLLAGLASTAGAQTMDNLNGVWTVELNGQGGKRGLSESYHGIRIRLLPDGRPVDLVREGDVLTSEGATSTSDIVSTLDGDTVPANHTGPKVRLTMKGFDTPRADDDSLVGTWFGKQAKFTRDVTARRPIEIDMGKGDRPWVRFMREVLIPKSAEDRETYHRFDEQYGGDWIKNTELGAKRYWINKGWVKNDAAFERIFADYDGTLNTPRNVLSTKLNKLVSDNMRPDKKGEIGLALSQLGMYFSTASGGALRLIVTENRDSIVYYITDKRAHERTGLVVNATPTHRPLASSFGKWQNDAGEMTLEDDEPYDRAVLELMVKSNTSSMNKVSGTGRGAFTDYFGIMAIEDQRGVMFGNDDLDWGRNMTEASFVISIIRAMSHGQTRRKPEYRPAPEKTIQDEPLSGMRAHASGQLMPSRSIKPKSIRIEAPGLPAVLDDGEGTLHYEGKDPADESVGYISYEDGSYNLDWSGFAKQARASFKSANGAPRTRELSGFTVSVSTSLEPGKIEPKSVRVKGGAKDLVDDGDGALYEEGADPQQVDARGWIDYDGGSLDCSWEGIPAQALTVSFKTTDGQTHSVKLEATTSSSGHLDPLDIVPGSVRFAAGGGAAIVDDGKGRLREQGAPADAPSRGSVDYASGTFDVRWSGVPAGAVKATFKDGSNQPQTLDVQVSVSASGKLASAKVTPKSIRIRAAGLPDVVDDGEGTLHDTGSDPQESDRGYVDYESGQFSISWSGVPGGGTAKVTYKTKAGEIVLTSAKELAMQVVVDEGDGAQLMPGTPSYIDILNGAENALEGGHKGGNDCQVGGMSTMEELTTKWLRAEQPAAIDRLEQALKPFGYDVGTDNLFASMTWTFYDAANFSKVTPAQGDEIVEAGMNVFRTIRKRSRDLEKFMLANGVTKSDRWAPRASGF